MSEFEQRLESFVGCELRPVQRAQDEVNVPMIRHWVEAMGDANPIYLDDDAARATGRAGVVAPAAMMQAWTMRGFAATLSSVPDVQAELFGLLDEAGFTSVVATDSEFEFFRELAPGDHVSVSETLESISPQKRTALGTGHFITSLRTYTDDTGEVVATQRWRLLRFRPSEEPEQPSAPRPRPALNQDNVFWFDACREHRLLIQRCTSCEVLRHPPGPCCPECGSFDWDTVQASGHATVYSYVVAHHPKHPAFEYPLIVAVVELAEGTRLITNLVGVAPEQVEIGMPVRLEWLDADEELTLPVFRPVAPGSAHEEG